MRSPRTPTKSSPHSPQLEKACTQQRRPNAAKKLINFKKRKKKKKVNVANGGEDVEEMEFCTLCWQEWKMVQLPWKTVWQVLKC